MNEVWLVSYLALWALLATMTAVLVSVMRSLGIVYAFVKAAAPKVMPAGTDLETGQVLPDIVLRTPAGEPTPVSMLRGARHAIDLVSPTCGPCLAYLRQVVSGDRAPDALDPTVRLRLIV